MVQRQGQRERAHEHEITEEKLRRNDYFRIQVQLKRNDKLEYAAIYNFIADRFPDIAKRRRDELAAEAIKRLEEDFETMIDADPNIIIQHRKWLEDNIHDHKIMDELNTILRKRYSLPI